VDWAWVGAPIDVRALFPVERLQLLTVLRALDAPEWGRATACPGWTVHDIAAHLVHDYVRRLSGTRDRHPSAGPARGEAVPAFLARVNQEFVDVARRWSPAVLVDLLEHLGPHLDSLWAGLDLSVVGEGDVWWADPEVPAPVWLDVAREFSEFWVHQQQIREAVGRPGADDPVLLGPVIDTFMRGLPNTLGVQHAEPGRSVRVEVHGPGGGTWVASLDRSRWRLDGKDDHRADAVVQISSDTLWRLATRGLSPEQARQRASLSGDHTLASAVLQLLSIIR
jgi:uncharacterized protein (TIGR03083 family)